MNFEILCIGKNRFWGRPLFGLVLLMTGAAAAGSGTNALGVMAGSGVLGSHLSQRSYTGLVYDWSLPRYWQPQAHPWLRIYSEFNLSRWGGCAGAYCRQVTDVGVTPLLRFSALAASGVSWYAEGGLGVHLISHTRIGPQVYSTAFQFSEFAGIGLLLGRGRRYDVGVRYMHESNSDLKTPNDGMNFLLLRLAVCW